MLLVDWIVLTILIVYSMARCSPAQTMSTSANQRRAQLTQNSLTSDSNATNPSSLGAISTSVDAAIDRRVNVDRQNELTDPSLKPLRTAVPNVNGEDETSVQTQLGTPSPSNGGRARYSALAGIPFTTSNWSLTRVGPSQDTIAWRDRSHFHSPKGHLPSSHDSAGTGCARSISSAPTPTSADGYLRRARVPSSNFAGRNKVRLAGNRRLGTGLQSSP
jgi:hypothetical protein